MIIADANEMKIMKSQRGMNILEIAIVLAAVGTASNVAWRFKTDNMVLYWLAVMAGFLVWFLPTIYVAIRDRQENKKKGP
jgi:hypothetical protein